MKFWQTRFTKLKAIGICLAVFVYFLGWANLVQAHAFLLRSEPSDNSVLTETPSEIKLWFTEPTVPQFNSVELFDIDGNSLPLRNITEKYGDSPSPGEHTGSPLLVYAPGVLGQGVYTVNWKVISAADGHISNGYFVFKVDPTTAGLDAQGIQAVGAGNSLQKGRILPPLPDIVLRWAIFWGLIILTGAAGMLTLVIKAPTEAGEDLDWTDRAETQIRLDDIKRQAAERLLKLAFVTTSLLFVITILQLAWQMSALVKSGSVSGFSFHTIGLLFDTPWGYAWLARQVILGILFGIFLYKRNSAKKAHARAPQ